MMVSSTKKDIGYELRETEIDGLSDLYFPQEDKDSPIRDVADVLFRYMINKDSSVSNMRRFFRESGQPCLFDDGIKKMEQGLTTIEEVLRVTEVYGRNAEEVFIENAR